MSNEKVRRAELPGHQGPFFPTNIEELQQVLYGERMTFNGDFLEKLGLQIPGFVDKHCPKTSDGYTWFWSLDFEKLSILFPWGQDFAGADRTSADRHIAIYFRPGNVDMLVAERTISLILKIISSPPTQKKE